jgi:hypothetical protein
VSCQSPFWPHSPTCDQALNALVQIRQVRFHLDLRDSGLELPNYWNAHKVNMYVSHPFPSSVSPPARLTWRDVCVCGCMTCVLHSQKQS